MDLNYSFAKIWAAGFFGLLIRQSSVIMKELIIQRR
jgi:hypothetical protein